MTKVFARVQAVVSYVFTYGIYTWVRRGLLRGTRSVRVAA